jgi:nitroreductase
MSDSKSRRAFIATGAGSATLALNAPAQSANATLQTIGKLRTIHGDFSDKAVTDVDLQTVLDASVRAANASALQSYSIVVVRDPAKMKQLCGYQASCLLLYSVDFTRVVDTAAHLGYQYGVDNIDSFISGSTSTIVAAQTAVIAAKSLGIDSLLTNGIHRGDIERLWTLLELPANSCFPLIALLLGYPKTEPAYQKGRLTGAGIVHKEKYQRLTKPELQALVEQYDDKSRHLGLVENWDTLGHKHYLDWLYKTWLRTPSKPTTSETGTLRRLKKSGFVESQRG